MSKLKYNVRDALPGEFKDVGRMMVEVYSKLDGFPGKSEQPEYYKKLSNIGMLTHNPQTRLLIAVDTNGKIGGGVVYFGDMTYYGSGGTASNEKNAAGFRLLAVAEFARGYGVGKLLTNTCLQLARNEGHDQMVIHSTEAMRIAWSMYEKMGFKLSLIHI